MSQYSWEGKLALEVGLGWHICPSFDTGERYIWQNGGTIGYQRFWASTSNVAAAWWCWPTLASRRLPISFTGRPPIKWD
jgi:hypothetical protein